MYHQVQENKTSDTADITSGTADMTSGTADMTSGTADIYCFIDIK